ncbi:MAG: hypothetical protein ACRC7C_06715 [Beijerinckiaceae bacterium]
MQFRTQAGEMADLQAAGASPQAHSPQQAMSEIRIFAGQMQEMTALVARLQSDMTRQMEAANLRMERAAEAVASGEARVAAQLAAVERVGVEARRAAEDHGRVLREATERMVHLSGEFSQQATVPFRRELDGAIRAMTDARLRLTDAAEGLTGAAAGAATTLTDRAAEASRQQTARLVDVANAAISGGEQRLRATTEALDGAAGALASRIVAAAEAQDAKLQAFEALAVRAEALAARMADPDALRASLDPAVISRIDDASTAINLASSKIIGAAIELRQAKPVAGEVELAQLTSHVLGLEASVTRASAERHEATVEVLARLDALGEQIAIKPIQLEADPEKLPALDVEREAMKRMTVGYRLMMRDLGQENRRMEGLVDALAERIRQLDERAAAKQVSDVAIAAAAVDNRPAASLPSLDAEKESLQRMLVGFRLLLQNIDGETGRLRASVDEVAGSARQPARAIAAIALPPAFEQIADRLSGTIETLERRIADIPVPETVRLIAPMGESGPSADALPLLEAEKESLQRLTVGFRLLLKDIGVATEELRAKVGEIRQPDTLVLAPSIEAEALKPLNDTADRIGEGVAETLLGLERKLAEPIALLQAMVADSAQLLKAAHASMAAPARAAPRPAVAAPDPEALADAVIRMESAATLIDTRLSDASALLKLLKKGGALGSDALRDTVERMESASGALRQEAGAFLAVGAALSRDLEALSGSAATKAAASDHRRTAIPKKRFA